jgi:hypothetical protein
MISAENAVLETEDENFDRLSHRDHFIASASAANARRDRPSPQGYPGDTIFVKRLGVQADP